MMLKHFLSIALLLCLTSCMRPSDALSVEPLTKYNGMTVDEMKNKLGKPYFEDSYPLSKAKDIMRGHLQQYFKKDFQYKKCP